MVLVKSFFWTVLQSVVWCEWVEIPQLGKGLNKSQFVLASPHSIFTDYKTVMTSTFQPLTPETSVFLNEAVSGRHPDDAMAGILPIFSTIQETLTNGARKAKSKIGLLSSLRDNLLENIHERMTNLWSIPVEQLSEARGFDTHEMEFPSNEGALMTIGFLTFAVFLIKLVLKLIYALKEKNNPTTTTTTMTGATTTTVIGRKKRGLDYNSLKILQFIEEYEIK